MATWHIDSSKLPIVIHTVEGNLSDADYDAYVQAGTEVFLSSGPHVTILDASRLGLASAYARKRNLDWLRAQRARLEASCLGLAYVVSSPLIRFMTMTVLMMIQFPVPIVVCETREQAVFWAEEKVRSTRS